MQAEQETLIVKLQASTYPPLPTKQYLQQTLSDSIGMEVMILGYKVTSYNYLPTQVSTIFSQASTQLGQAKLFQILLIANISDVYVHETTKDKQEVV